MLHGIGRSVEGKVLLCLVSYTLAYVTWDSVKYVFSQNSCFNLTFFKELLVLYLPRV